MSFPVFSKDKKIKKCPQESLPLQHRRHVVLSDYGRDWELLTKVKMSLAFHDITLFKYVFNSTQNWKTDDLQASSIYFNNCKIFHQQY